MRRVYTIVVDDDGYIGATVATFTDGPHDPDDYVSHYDLTDGEEGAKTLDKITHEIKSREGMEGGDIQKAGIGSPVLERR